MINTVTKQHSAEYPRCPGDLQFDAASEMKWGLVWRERVICNICNYHSAMYNLYEEIETGGKGRRSATANVGFNIALTQTPAAATSVIKMLLGGNVAAPSRSSMQKCATKVCKIIKKANIADMKDRRQQLKKLNKWQNQPENVIAVQCDGMYNNNLYSGVGHTPFQPATQCCYTVAENMTEKKQIIAMETVNKLCSKKGFHTAADDECRPKVGCCTATASMETNIGDEEKWAKLCFQDLKEDNLELNFITTDPDTKAFHAAQTLYADKHTGTMPQHQLDTRHLEQNHRKKINSNAAVLSMMPGGTQVYRKYLRSRFALDISTRCHAEFQSAFEETRGDFQKLTTLVHRSISAVQKCYCGDHSSCRAHSKACDGSIKSNWIQKSCYLPRNFKIDASKAENKEALLECIEYRLSDDMLQLTRLNTNSQKVEGFNRSLRRSLPKNVTFSRNFSGRAHAAAHSVNNGPGTSIKKLCKAAGCPIPENSKVARRLQKLDQDAEMKKIREKSLKYKQKRKERKLALYQLHERHQEERKYIKNQLMKTKRNQSKALAELEKKLRKQVENPDHDYNRNPRANQLVTQKRQAGACPP